MWGRGRFFFDIGEPRIACCFVLPDDPLYHRDMPVSLSMTHPRPSSGPLPEENDRASAGDSAEQLSHKGIVPRGLFSSASDTASGWTVVEQIESNFSQQSEIVPSMLVPDAGRVFLKRDIQHPMQTVFNQPVLPYGGDLPLIFNWQTGQIKPPFCRDCSMRFDHPNRFHRQNAADSRPFCEHVQLGWYWVHKHPAPGETSMALVKGIQHGLQSTRHRKGMLQETWVSTACSVRFWLPFNVST
jgi:hypothetical protein